MDTPPNRTPGLNVCQVRPISGADRLRCVAFRLTPGLIGSGRCVAFCNKKPQRGNSFGVRIGHKHLWSRPNLSVYLVCHSLWQPSCRLCYARALLCSSFAGVDLWLCSPLIRGANHYAGTPAFSFAKQNCGRSPDFSDFAFFTIVYLFKKQCFCSPYEYA